MKKKKVCLIINTLSRGGGAERTVQNLSRKYDDEGYEVTIILIDGLIIGYDFNTNIKIKTLNFKKDFNVVRTTLKLGNILKNENFDIVISFLFRANIFNIFASKLFRISPIVISERSFSKHNYNQRNIKNYIFKKLLKYSYSKVNAIIAISNGVKESLINDMGVSAEIEVIYNPVNILKQQNAEKKIRSKKIYNLVTVGRLIDSKNQQKLLEVVALLKESGIEVSFSILGEGEMRGLLEKKAVSLNIQKEVIFHGYVKSPEKILKESDFFIFASKYEAFGNVILEAMREGLPIITYRSKGGPVEIIGESQFGLIIEDFSAEEMAKKILFLIKNPDYYNKLSRLSLERIEDFSIDKIADDYINTFIKVSGETMK